MTLDRKDYESSIPQLEKRIKALEKKVTVTTQQFETLASKLRREEEDRLKHDTILDYSLDTVRVQMFYALVPTGYDPDDTTQWEETMPNLDPTSYAGKTLWYKSVTYVNDVVVRETQPQTVEIMDGVYSFVNSVAADSGWTTIDGDTIQTGRITSHNGNCYFDIDANNFQMKDNSTLASSTNALAWDDGQLYIKGKIAIGNTISDKTYYTEMAGGGFDIVANNVNLAHIGYDFGNKQGGGAAKTPYFTLGSRKQATDEYNPTKTYDVGDMCVYNGVSYICIWKIATPETFTPTNWQRLIGNYSSAFGENVTASGYSSAAYGSNTTAIADFQTVVGTWNKIDFTDLFQIGRGGYSDGVLERLNVFAIDHFGKIKTNQIQTGSIDSATVTSGSIRTVGVTFQHQMSDTPVVVASLLSGSPNSETGGVSVGVSEISPTGFTCKVFNNSGKSLSPAVQWIAVNVGLP